MFLIKPLCDPVRCIHQCQQHIFAFLFCNTVVEDLQYVDYNIGLHADICNTVGDIDTDTCVRQSILNLTDWGGDEIYVTDTVADMQRYTHCILPSVVVDNVSLT